MQGSGPFGIPLPQDVQALTNRLQASLGKSWPQIQELLNLPGALEARQMLVNGLMQRATARFVKLLLGAPPAQPKLQQRQLASGELSQVAVLPPKQVEAELLPPLRGPEQISNARIAVK